MTLEESSQNTVMGEDIFPSPMPLPSEVHTCGEGHTHTTRASRVGPGGMSVSEPDLRT